MRRDVDIHADIEILKLRVDQRVDADADADARLERAGRDRYAVPDFQGCLLSVHARESADFVITSSCYP